MQKNYSKNGIKSMEYKIRISDTCLEQIEDTLNYLDNELKKFNASNRLRSRIKEIFYQIKFFPKIYQEILKKDKTKRNYRKIVIYNYIILYTIIEKDKIIFISDFYYVRRDYFNY